MKVASFNDSKLIWWNVTEVKPVHGLYNLMYTSMLCYFANTASKNRILLQVKERESKALMQQNWTTEISASYCVYKKSLWH